MRPVGGLGIVYNFPETNPSSVIPNTTFSVDVPMEAMVRDAAAISYPYLAQMTPSLVSAAWPYIEPRVQSSVQLLIDQNVATITSRLTDEARRRSQQAAIVLAGVVGAVLIWRRYHSRR